jgi:tight adherence protein C
MPDSTLNPQELLALADTQFRAGIIAALIVLAILIFLTGLLKERRHRETQQRIEQFVGSAPPDPGELEYLNQGFVERIIKPGFRGLLNRLGKLSPNSNRDRLRRDLMMAGNPGNLTTIDFVGLKFVGAAVFAFLAGSYSKTVMDAEIQKVVLYTVGGLLLGAYYPTYWLRNKINRRNQAIRKALPDALDMLTIVVDAGMGFDQALIKLRERWKNELTLEFERVVNEMRMGVRKVDALHNMAERSDVAELRSFIAVLVQTDRLGISISNVLHAQSQQMRTRRRQEAEEEAHRAPIKMLVPIMLFILPALFAIILGPAVPAIMSAF